MEENQPIQPIQTPIPQSVIQPPQPPIRPKKAWKKWILVILVLLLLFSLPLGGYFILNQLGIAPKPSKVVIQNIKPTPTLDQTEKWITYTNNYYKFKLDIPSDWKVEEKVIKDKEYANGEYQIYKLSSPNGELTIDNKSMFDKNNHIKESLPNTKVQLGKYVVDRYPYINDDNQRIDNIQLLNIYRQNPITFIFNFKSEIKKNNELLLKVLKTFRFTNPMPNLEDEILYTLPTGWTKPNPNINEWLYFHSIDYTAEGIDGSILTGAEIFVEKTKRNFAENLIQQASESLSSDFKIISTKSATFNSISFINIVYACNGKSEICRETYATEKKGSIWTISLSCGKDCKAIRTIKNMTYSESLSAFVSSIKFK